jgi:hypothetical protein
MIIKGSVFKIYLLQHELIFTQEISGLVIFHPND